MKGTLTPAGPGPVGASRSTRTLRRWAALGAASCVVASALAFPVTAVSAAGKCGSIVKRGSWESISVPSFSAGGRTIVDYAVARDSSGLLLVTNGTVVARSTDGGCAWKETFKATAPTGDLPVAKGEIKIRSIALPETASSPVLLLAEERVGGSTRPRIFRSSNGGASFTTSDAGLLPAGTPEALRIAPGSPNVAYLAVSHGNDLFDQLYATEDGGATWTLRTDLTEAVRRQNLSGFEVDPKVASELWAWGPAGGYHSTDGGRNFTSVDELAGRPTGPVDVTRLGNTPSRIAYFQPLRSDMMVSTNGGDSWLALGAPSGIDSAAHGTELMEMLIGTEEDRIFLYLPTANAWVDLESAPGSRDVEVSRRGQADYYARTATTIERYVGDKPTPPPESEPGQEVIVPSIEDLPGLRSAPAKLTGPTDELVLRPGKSRTMTYMLDLPKGQRPLDLFFLVDTTGSMKKLISGLKVSMADIVNGLAQAGIAAQVGLGEYRAYPDHFPPRPDEPNFIYKLRADLSSDGEALRSALQALEFGGGGQYDAQLGALEQTATGEGVDLDPQDPDDGSDQNNTIGQDVPPGQQPNFRQVAEENGEPLRLVLNISNEPFGQPNPSRGDIDNVADSGSLTPPPIPSFEEVISKLNTRGIKQIGLEMGRAPGTYEDLVRVARGTGADAPGQGVDCNGDGIADIAGGAPLVCRMGGDADAVSNIAPAIVNLVKALPLSESPGMEIPQGGRVVSKVTPDSYDGVPLQSGQSLPFRVTFSCARNQAGERFPVTLQATGSSGALAELRTAVRCAALPEKADEEPTPPPPAIPTIFAPITVIPLLPPIAPPSAPIPLTEITSATSSQAQTQAQAQAQAAAAAQRQHQPQLAFAHAQKAKHEVAKEEEYEMSAFNRREPEMPPSLALVAAAAAMSFAFGMAMKRKNAARVAPARRRF